MFEVPDSMSDEDAAGFMIPAHTAWHAVHRRGQVQAGRDRRCARRRRRSRRGDRAAVRGRGLRRDRGGRRRGEGGGGRGAWARGPSTIRPVDAVEGVRAATDGAGARRARRSGAGRDRCPPARPPRARRAARAVRARRWADRARPALLRAQPHAGRRHPRRLPARRDAPHPPGDPGRRSRRSWPTGGTGRW